MSTTVENHGQGLAGAVIYAVILALLGYALGYVLLLLAGSNLIVVSVSNLTAYSTVRNIVTAQYAGATVLPYLFAFVMALGGFAYGYLKHKG